MRSLAVVTAATTSVEVGCEAVLVSVLFFLSSPGATTGAEAALAALTSDLVAEESHITILQ